MTQSPTEKRNRWGFKLDKSSSMSSRSSTSHEILEERKKMPQSPDKSTSELGLEKSEDVAFAPIAAPNDERDAPLQKQRSNAARSMRSVERSWSLNDGTSIGRNEVDEAVEEDTEFTVGWDENDPMNPRNMSKGRRWLIVVIVSMGSLCV
jgi:hypothetical protein